MFMFYYSPLDFLKTVVIAGVIPYFELVSVKKFNVIRVHYDCLL